MGLLSSLRALLTRERPHSGGWWWSPRTQAGQAIDEHRALMYSAVWGCVRIISEGIATLPWQIYQKTAKGRKELSNDTSWILQAQPNPEQSPFIFKELMIRRALLGGNAYAEIQRDAGGRPVALWPIVPDRVKPDRHADDGRLIYRVQDSNKGETILEAADMFHLKGPGGDGLTGFSVIRMAAESIGLGLAMEEFGSSFFGNGAHLGGVLQHPKQLSTEAKKNLTDSFEQTYSRKNSLRMAVLEEGMTYARIGIPPEDAQFLESRKAQVIEICRWYRVPPHKLAELDRATWSNIEQLAIEFVTDAIVPWCCRMEEEANAKLFGRNNRGTVYTKFNVAALLRGDMKSRYDAFAVGRQWGWLSANDVRECEDMNPVSGGDIYLTPANMTTPKRLIQLEKQPVTAPIAPDPAPDPAEPPKNHLRLNGNGAGHA